jgi:hypothetical protein
LLEQCPGEPLCDACLAFACAVSLTEMRVVTTTVGHDEPFARTTATCASCRRQTTTLAWGLPPAKDKCAYCSGVIEPSGRVEVVDTDWFHRHCWLRLTSAESVRASKALSRRSRDLIRRSRERTGLSPLEETAEGS